MNRRCIRYLVDRVLVGLAIALILSFAHRAFAADDPFYYLYQFRGSFLSDSDFIYSSPSDAIEGAIEAYESRIPGSSYSPSGELYVSFSHGLPFSGSQSISDSAAVGDDRIVSFRASPFCSNGSGPPTIFNGSYRCAEPPKCPAAGTEFDLYLNDVSHVAERRLEGDNVVDQKGCGYESTGDAFCLISDDHPGHVTCLLGYVSTGSKSTDPNAASDLGQLMQTSPPPPADGKSTVPATSETTKTAPDESEYADGSTSVTQTTVKSSSDGGYAKVTDGGQTAVEQLPSSSNTTIVKTTTTNVDGSVTVEKHITVEWQNGDTYTYTVSGGGGGIQRTHTNGTGGSGSKTTTTTTNPDGSSTSSSTSSGGTSSSGGGGGSDYDCDLDTGTCEYIGDEPSGNTPDGSDSDSGGGSGDGSGIEGSGTCDPTQSDCGQSDEGGKFAGSPFPALNDQPTVAESAGNLIEGLKSTPLLSAIDGISAGVPAAGNCPFGSTHLGYLDADIDFSAGCDLYDEHRATLSTAAKVAWSLLGVVILLGI